LRRAGWLARLQWRTMAGATKDTFYITSAIYYVNDVPHVGHTYEIVACDVIARYHRLRGEKVFFLTGTDEHSQNVARAAAERGVTPQEWADQIVPAWKDVFSRLLISNDDFIRTSEGRHVERVQQFVQVLYDRGQIYRGSYEGPYCVSCEEFKNESELVDGNKCPIHHRPVDYISEENYFFRLSNYQGALLNLYQDNPEFIGPETRRNEVVSFVRSGLRDLSISRAAALWGVPIPWDPKHVTYVWVDALLNYITAPGFGAEPERFNSVWPADVHVIGKDITRFHAVIWPAMLMAAELPLPKRVYAHGFLNVGGQKMSKSAGTGVAPAELIERFGVDAYRYYFLREVSFGQDGSYSPESMLARYNAELANGLGNLASRVLAMVDSYFEGRVPRPSDDQAPGRLPVAAETAAKRYDQAMLGLELSEAVAALDELVRESNRFLVDVAPWNLAKDPGMRQELADVLYGALEVLRVIAVLASPVMPETASELARQLGIATADWRPRLPEDGTFGGLEPGTAIQRGRSLFPRLDA
jgi:methionyl-tRNA synthetase